MIIPKTMRFADSTMVREFENKAIYDPQVCGYFNGFYSCRYAVDDSTNWESNFYIHESGNAMLVITRQQDDNGISIHMWVLDPDNNAGLAGTLLKTVDAYIKAYKPRYMKSTVAGTNEKALSINRKLLGEPWGIEPKSNWNSIRGDYEDLHHFRKYLKYEN